MKKWFKYIVSTIIFFASYILMQYLLVKSIDWKMTIVSTIMYAVLYTVFDIYFSKKIEQ